MLSRTHSYCHPDLPRGVPTGVRLGVLPCDVLRTPFRVAAPIGLEPVGSLKSIQSFRPSNNRPQPANPHRIVIESRAKGVTGVRLRCDTVAWREDGRLHQVVKFGPGVPTVGAELQAHGDPLTGTVAGVAMEVDRDC